MQWTNICVGWIINCFKINCISVVDTMYLGFRKPFFTSRWHKSAWFGLRTCIKNTLNKHWIEIVLKFFYLWWLDDRQKLWSGKQHWYFSLCYPRGFLVKIIYPPVLYTLTQGFLLDLGLFRPKQKCQDSQWVWIWSWFHEYEPFSFL